jgi:hypothetical protein
MSEVHYVVVGVVREKVDELVCGRGQARLPPTTRSGRDRRRGIQRGDDESSC